MRLAVTVDQNTYLSSQIVPVLGVEVVDPTQTVDEATSVFKKKDNSTEYYVKVVIDAKEDNYKNLIINNFDQCELRKDATSGTWYLYTNINIPNNRALTSIDSRYPLLTDQYLTPFIG